jgi:serine phosphatase RsbU (regulator of sigma subunit)
MAFSFLFGNRLHEKPGNLVNLQVAKKLFNTEITEFRRESQRLLQLCRENPLRSLCAISACALFFGFHDSAMNRTCAAFSLFCLVFGHALPAHCDERPFLSAEILQQHDRLRLEQHWKYHPGDNPEWARPEFDDTAWETAAPTLRAQSIPPSGWTGLGWFRIHLDVDSTLWHQTLALSIAQAGAASIYVDGRLIYNFGHDGLKQSHPESEKYRDYAAFSFSPHRHHVIAVRYANYSTRIFHQNGLIAGFDILIGDAGSMIVSGLREVKRDLTTQILFTTFAMAFGLLHLVLFLFSPHAKSHLYFALFVFLYAGNIFFDYQAFLAPDLRSELKFLRLHRALMPANPIFLLLFLYSLFTARIPKQFWLIALGLVVTGIFAVSRPLVNFNYVFIFIVAVIFETIRLMRAAVRSRRESVWIIVAGFLLLGIFSSYDLLLDLRLLEPVHGIHNGYTFGFLGLMIAMSIYLAREVAKTNARMLAKEREAREQEFQRRLLEADHARKTKELEEARKLQLSMLPKTIPRLANFEIAVCSKPATEVGGDYYDFHLAKDGTLTIAIGDATGHGMKAGIMVATMKSLFTAAPFAADLVEFFHQSSRVLKQMNLGNLYMAMTLLRLKDDHLQVAGAGMPPLLIHRAASGSVEEILMRTMPLGAPAGFLYEQKSVPLFAGDTVLMMTDGYAELFNDKDEMLDYPSVTEYFEKAASHSPAGIIEHLLSAGEKWRQGRSQHDDITFVVLQKVAQVA